jgi:hypothetical protein
LYEHYFDHKVGHTASEHDVSLNCEERRWPSTRTSIIPMIMVDNHFNYPTLGISNMF